MTPVSSRTTRTAYDRWRDIEGTPILDGCRVEQPKVDRLDGALRSRLPQRGEVVGRSQSNRLFDGEAGPISSRLHLVRGDRGDGDDR